MDGAAIEGDADALGVVHAPPIHAPLGAAAEVREVLDPNQISRENGKWRIFVTANVRNMELANFVEPARAAMTRELDLPPGYWLDYGGVHMRASWIFSSYDVIANVGVIIAGGLVWSFGVAWLDLLIGCLIAIVVLRGGLRILSEVAKEANGDECQSQSTCSDD